MGRAGVTGVVGGGGGGGGGSRVLAAAGSRRLLCTCLRASRPRQMVCTRIAADSSSEKVLPPLVSSDEPRPRDARDEPPMEPPWKATHAAITLPVRRVDLLSMPCARTAWVCTRAIIRCIDISTPRSAT